MRCCSAIADAASRCVQVNPTEKIDYGVGVLKDVRGYGIGIIEMSGWESASGQKITAYRLS